MPLSSAVLFPLSIFFIFAEAGYQYDIAPVMFERYIPMISAAWR